MKKKPDPSGEEEFITAHSDPGQGFWGSWKLFGRRKRDVREMQCLYGPPEMLRGLHKPDTPAAPDPPDENDKGEHHA